MSLFQPDQGEKVLMKVAVMWNPSKFLACPGEVHITDRRFVFEKHLTPGATAITAWIVKSYRPRIVADVPLKDIQKVRLTKVLIGSRKKMHFEYGGNTLTVTPDNHEDILTLLPNTVQVVEE